jgi:hypothetical protein
MELLLVAVVAVAVAPGGLLYKHLILKPYPHMLLLAVVVAVAALDEMAALAVVVAYRPAAPGL